MHHHTHTSLPSGGAASRLWLGRLIGLLAASLVLFWAAPAAAQDDADDPRINADGPDVRVPPIRPAQLGPAGNPLPLPQEEPEDGGGAAPAPRNPKPTSSSSGGGTAPAAGGGTVVTDRNKPPCATPATVQIDFLDKPVGELVRYMAETSCRNLILGDEPDGKVTIISHTPVSYWAAYAAMESALEVAGYTMVEVGTSLKVVKVNVASQAPVQVYNGGTVPATDRVVTQILQPENVSVSEISTVAKELAGPNAKIIAYVPTNTLIVTDSAYNIRRMWKVVSQLDVAAPKATVHVVQIQYADATEVKKIIEEVYGTEQAGSTTNSNSSSNSGSSSSRRRRRRGNSASTPAAGGTASASNVGSQGKYIEKIVADERTNSLIILANEGAMKVVMELVAEVDKDVDPSSRAQIHVVYLEHAKAEDVAQVLSNLSQEGASNRTNSSSNSRNNRANARANPRGRQETPAAGDTSSSDSITALLDDGVRITADENTNSLVIVASPEAFEILEQVISKLDIRRKQVFVEVVIMEVSGEDTLDVGVGVHTGVPNEAGVGFGSAQLGTTTALGLSTDLLSGMAMGVFGDTIDVTVDGQPISIPAFGVAMQAIQADSSVNILSTPNILTLDNEEAKIVVGRTVPFPTGQGRDSNNNPIISFQREDVAITLKVTPQINESDYVTLEVYQEVTEIEEDSTSLDVTQSGGPVTSKRTAETTVLVKDNQTVVIGGLMASTDTHVETKVPVLGDLPVVGVLFRGQRKVTRKTNLLIFLTPHVVSEPEDLEEIYRIKVAQRDEFLRRFYGKSEVEQQQALNDLLRYSMNIVDEPSVYRTRIDDGAGNVTTIGTVDDGEAKDEGPADPRVLGQTVDPSDAPDPVQPADTQGDSADDSAEEGD